MKSAILTLAIMAALPAHAYKTCQDDWKPRPDKQLHFIGSALMTQTFTIAMDDPVKGAALSIAIGGTYELVTGCASKQDFGYDIAGSLIGAATGYGLNHWIIRPRFIGYKGSF